MSTPDAVGVAASSRVQLTPYSRFRASMYYPTLGPAYGRWPFNGQTFQVLPSDQYHVVQQGEQYNWQLLAYRLLGGVQKWWVLALANNRIDAWDGPVVGETIRVPDASNVAALLHTAR